MHMQVQAARRRAIMLSFQGFTQIGSLQDYTRRRTLEHRLQQKKQSGNLLQKTPVTCKTDAGREMAAKKASDQQLLTDFMESQSEKDTKLESICNKVVYGQDLSDEEIEYLKDKNPELYNKFKQEESDRKALEKKLENADTKEEAQQVVRDKINEGISKINLVKDNPYITESDKLAIYAEVNRAVRRASKELIKFQESGEYDKLPSEADLAKERADETRREQEEQLEAMEQFEESTAPQEGEEPEETGKADSTAPQNSGDGNAAVEPEQDNAPETAKPQKQEPLHQGDLPEAAESRDKEKPAHAAAKTSPAPEDIEQLLRDVRRKQNPLDPFWLDRKA